MARAINSFPVPLSPVIRTVASLGATRITCAVTPQIALEEPTISSNIDVDRTSSRRSSVSSSSSPLIPVLARFAATSVKSLDPRSSVERECRGGTASTLVRCKSRPPQLVSCILDFLSSCKCLLRALVNLRPLSCHPFADVGGAISELNSPVLRESKEFHSFSVDKKNVLEIDGESIRFLFQLASEHVDVLSCNSPAYGQHHRVFRTNDSVDSAAHCHCELSSFCYFSQSQFAINLGDSKTATISQVFDNEGPAKIDCGAASVNHANSANSRKSSKPKVLKRLGGGPFAEFELLFVDFQGLDPSLKGRRRNSKLSRCSYGPETRTLASARAASITSRSLLGSTFEPGDALAGGAGRKVSLGSHNSSTEKISPEIGR